MTPDSRTVVTMKWGDRYGAEYPNRLFAAVQRFLSPPFRFVCFTDDAEGLAKGIEPLPLPEIELPERFARTPWRKISLFRPDLPISGPCLFMDLDMVILDSLDEFFTYESDKIPIIHNWVGGLRRVVGNRPEIGNSSVFRFRGGEDFFVWEQFLSEREWALENFRPPQSYLTHCIRPRMTYWPEEWTRSFKRHCRPVFPLNLVLPPRKPQGTKILVFHGHPFPDEAIAGFAGTRPHHRTLPAPWVADYWTPASPPNTSPSP